MRVVRRRLVLMKWGTEETHREAVGGEDGEKRAIWETNTLLGYYLLAMIHMDGKEGGIGMGFIQEANSDRLLSIPLKGEPHVAVKFSPSSNHVLPVLKELCIQCRVFKRFSLFVDPDISFLSILDENEKIWDL